MAVPQAGEDADLSGGGRCTGTSDGQLPPPRWPAVCALVLLAGCVTASPPPGLAERRHLSTTSEQLRIQVRALAGPYVGAIEEAADASARSCPAHPEGTTLALQWKLSAIPQVQDALFQADPLVGLLDGWAYAVQMRDWLQSDAGRSAFGECRNAAAAAMSLVAGRFRQICDVIAPDRAELAEGLVEQWASSHPLRSLFLPRVSTAITLANESARRDLGALAAVETVVETLDDLTARIAAYRETMLKEAAWTGELVAMRAASSDIARQTAEDAQRVADSMARFGRLADRLPALVELERAAVTEALRSEREQILAALDAQRRETLALAQSERAVILDRIDTMRASTIERVGEQSEALIDRFFLRALQLGLCLLAAIVAVVAVSLLAFRTWFRRHAER